MSIIWTPSCGTGALAVDLAEHIYGLIEGLIKVITAGNNKG
ncbi:hypothetical protein [Sporomusa carbonis]